MSRALDSFHGLKNLGNGIFWIGWTSHYDMAMSMLRVQEHYESVGDEFRGKIFSLVSYMRWYSHKFGEGAFTYPDDFCGYNYPGREILSLLRDRRDEIPDWNEYDESMLAIAEFVEKLAGTDDFYLISTVRDDEATFKHEYAHAMYGQLPSFKEAQDALVLGLPDETVNRMKVNLIQKGYADGVHLDEIQATLSTEDEEDLIEGVPNVRAIRKAQVGLRSNLEVALSRIRHLFPPRV